jgi:hypothetical protein
MTQNTQPQTVQQVLRSIPQGQFFSVIFTKRTTGEVREMVCRHGVHKHLRGGELKYDPDSKGLMTVWSPDSAGKHGPQDAGYRAIPVRAITEVRAMKRKWTFKPTE